MWLLPARRALQEIDRIQRFVYTLRSEPDDEAVWDALEKNPAPPLPGVLMTLLYSPFHPRQRPYGMTVSVRADFLSRDGGERYYAIVLPSGRIALGCPCWIRINLTSIFNRFAVDRLFEENGWKFPESLGIPEALAALGDVLTCGGRSFSWSPAPPDVVPTLASGELFLDDLKSTTPRGHLRWAPRRLWFELED